MIRKYGKSFQDLLDIKSTFISDEEKHIAGVEWESEQYIRQPKREVCKICSEKLTDEVYFASHGIDYKTCSNCGHLNGAYEETQEFTEEIYVKDDYGDFFYKEFDYVQFTKRMHAIYLPKAKFILDSLNICGENTYGFKYMDYGAGCGYMVAALRALSLNAFGAEISPHEAEAANKVLNGNLVELISQADSTEFVKNLEYEVVSFVSVLEHILDLNELFDALSKNRNIKYIFFNVPMFSFTCILEIINQAFFNRQLGGSHTHLFTKSSWEWIYKKYNFEPVAVWDFGSEMMDMMRFTHLQLARQGASQKLIDDVDVFFRNNGDEMQLPIDKSGFASETHVLLRNNNSFEVK